MGECRSRWEEQGPGTDLVGVLQPARIDRIERARPPPILLKSGRPGGLGLGVARGSGRWQVQPVTDPPPCPAPYAAPDRHADDVIRTLGALTGRAWPT